MINYAKQIFSLALMLMVSMAASADVKFAIEDVNIAPGAANIPVNVTMENTEEVKSFQFDLTLPEGLTPDLSNEAIKLTSRLNGYRVVANKRSDGKINFIVMQMPGVAAVAVGNGAIFSFPVTADATLDFSTAEISFSGTKVAQATGTTSAEDGDVIAVDESYQLSASSETILLQGEETADIEVSLENAGNLWGLQATLTLPTGVSLVNEKIEATGRLGSFESTSTTKRSDQEYVFIAATFVSTDPDVVHITGNTGAILKFTVKGSTSAVNGSAIKLHEITSMKSGKVGINLNSLTITVNTIDNAADVYKKLSDEIAALQKQLDDTKTQLNTEAPGVDITEDVKAIQDQIDALKANLEEAHSAQELNQESKLDEEAVKKVTDAIADMVNKVKVATGIGAVKVAASAGEIYTVAGQRVAAPVKGVNIINGKKVILK